MRRIVSAHRLTVLKPWRGRITTQTASGTTRMQHAWKDHLQENCLQGSLLPRIRKTSELVSRAILGEPSLQMVAHICAVPSDNDARVLTCFAIVTSLMAVNLIVLLD